MSSFENDVLIELLERSTNSEKMIKEHVATKQKYSSLSVFEQSFSGGEYYSFADSKFWKKTIRYSYDDSDMLDKIKLQHKLSNATFYYENYTPSNLRIKFSDRPPLEVKYQPNKDIVQTIEEYNIRPKWFKKPIKISVVKTITEYTPMYEISHGVIKAKISQKKFEDILVELNSKLSQEERRVDLNKAMERVRDLKKENK